MGVRVGVIEAQVWLGPRVQEGSKRGRRITADLKAEEHVDRNSDAYAADLCDLGCRLKA